jgi:hypothetical protein
MQFKKLSPTLTEIDGAVRVESGPVRKHAIATTDLLSDAVTAAHYKVGGRDALGKPIKIGEPMDYIDWLSSDRAWYVYQNVGTRSVAMKVGDPKQVIDWELKGSFDNEPDALTAATALLVPPTPAANPAA